MGTATQFFQCYIHNAGVAFSKDGDHDRTVGRDGQRHYGEVRVRTATIYSCEIGNHHTLYYQDQNSSLALLNQREETQLKDQGKLPDLKLIQLDMKLSRTTSEKDRRTLRRIWQKYAVRRR